MCGMFRWKWPRVLLLGSAPLGGDVRKAASCHRGSRGCDSETMSRLTSRTSACLVNATLCKDLWRHKRKERQGETGRRRSGEGDPPGRTACLPASRGVDQLARLSLPSWKLLGAQTRPYSADSSTVLPKNLSGTHMMTGRGDRGSWGLNGARLDSLESEHLGGFLPCRRQGPDHTCSRENGVCACVRVCACVCGHTCTLRVRSPPRKVPSEVSLARSTRSATGKGWICHRLRRGHCEGSGGRSAIGFENFESEMSFS